MELQRVDNENACSVKKNEGFLFLGAIVKRVP